MRSTFFATENWSCGSSVVVQRLTVPGGSRHHNTEKCGSIQAELDSLAPALAFSLRSMGPMAHDCV